MPSRRATAPPLVRTTSADRVYQHVLDELGDERLAPGAALGEDELARRFDTSRTPVREALRRLVQDGLVERHGAGLRVRHLTPDTVDEIYPIVAVLEGLAARLAAHRVSPADLDRLDALHATMTAAVPDGDHASYVEANQRFHEVVLAVAGSASLDREVQRFRLVTLQLRRHQLGMADRMASSSAEHAAILAALRSGDAERSEQLMRAHVDAGHLQLAHALAAAPLVDLSSNRRDPRPTTAPPTERKSS